MPKKPRTRRGIGPCAALCIAVLLATPLAARDDTTAPNIVLIMADDMGYECVGANGGTSYRTPHLDRLATGGTRFEHCYSQPICTPSRVQIMTGIYNQRNYIRFGLLDPAATTFAHLLKGAGYRTCVAGKWQLRGGVDGPRHFGFDEHCLWQLTVRRSRYPNPTLERNGEIIDYKDGEYGPDLVSDFIASFVRRNRERPFLVYYPMILPHWPFEPTPDSPDWDPKAVGVLKGQGRKRYFADMVAYTDKMVGKIVGLLEELDLERRTLLLFTCDNGTAVGVRSMMGKLTIHGGKGTTRDAGTRVPLIASWPGTVEAGAVRQDLVDFSDFLPTLLDVTGAKAPGTLFLDGQSFLPQLRGERGTPRDWTYCWYSRNGGPSGQEFARNQRFKLYRDGRFFDVGADHLEKTDLAGTGLDEDSVRTRAKLRETLAKFTATRRSYPEPPNKKAGNKKAGNKKAGNKKAGDTKTGDTKTASSRRELSAAQTAERTATAVAALREKGAHVFLRGGRAVEVNLNRSQATDDEMSLVASLPDLTDLSLEETAVGDVSMARLKGLRKLAWLNLYRTRVGDEGLRHLSAIASLELLPLGSTRITDAGLAHVASMTGLLYLGLRDNRVGDDGVRHLTGLTQLRGLHLGETKVTDAGLAHLEKLSRLEKLWLDDTEVSDASVDRLSKLRGLRELHVRRSRLTPAGVERLRAALPSCRVFHEPDDS